MPETEDLYEILQVHPSAHPDVIQAAYRRLAFLYHPDRNPSQEAGEMMKRLNLAYETLSDPDRRVAYDRTRGAQQRQRTETGSRDTHGERPRTSGPTSQSGTATTTTRPETRRVKPLRIMAIVAGLAVVVAIVAAAVSAAGGRDEGDGGDDGGSRGVALLPTRTPTPTTAAPRPTPTVIPAAGAAAGVSGAAALRPTATPTHIPTPTATPKPTSTPSPTATPLALPTAVPTAAPPIVERDYFTRGSSQDDVLHAQGTPTEIKIWKSLGDEDWRYGFSKVTFSLTDGRVTEWDNEGDLKVRLVPTTRESSTPGYFTRGSSQDDVLHAQGTPTEIKIWKSLGDEDWHYGFSKVTFSLTDGRVTEWDNEGDLKVRLVPTTRESSTPGYFTRGSSQDDVLHAQGTPTEIKIWKSLGDEDWHYGYSKVTFSLTDGRVTEWDNEGDLKVRLVPTTRESSTPGYFTRGSSQDDVLHAQGTPTEIKIWKSLGDEDWHYGYSKVTFSLTDGRVTEWDDKGNLKVR